ncbi:MAG: TIGR02301 family protein [Hyphomicrobiales bacterium]|nr:TIGR02301 family protein [Hyphomicrobiales bacterium]
MSRITKLALCLQIALAPLAADAQTKPRHGEGVRSARDKDAKDKDAKDKDAREKSAKEKEQNGKDNEAAKPAEAPPAVYEARLLRLAEILGALSYMRALCGADDAAKFRAQMAHLVETESAGDAGRRDRLAGAFNYGYAGYQATYRRCTPNAEIVIKRYLTEGDSIARDISSRYRGQ